MKCIAYCDIYNSSIHGYTNKSSINIHGHFIVRYSITNDEFYSGEYINLPYKTPTPTIYHPLIRNFHYISMMRYNTFDIVECIELSGGEMIAIIKTYYIRLLQRKWKKIYKTINVSIS
uniref:Uncharacterized protein n=1 Tax=viral metagenome TaxID=1070528 RepID=A0A6C0BSH6_9ZZZZ